MTCVSRFLLLDALSLTGEEKYLVVFPRAEWTRNGRPLRVESSCCSGLFSDRDHDGGADREILLRDALGVPGVLNLTRASNPAARGPSPPTAAALLPLERAIGVRDRPALEQGTANKERGFVVKRLPDVGEENIARQASIKLS